MDSTERPPATAWGTLIRLAREAAKMSRPQAVARAGGKVSKDNWANVEHGYQVISAGIWRDAPGNADTIAQMAHGVGLTPARLREAGRPDAADVLDEMIRQHDSGPRYADPVLQAIDRLEVPEADRRALIALAIGLRHLREGPAG